MKKVVALTAIVSVLFLGASCAKTTQEINANYSISSPASSAYDSLPKDTVLLCGKIEEKYAVTGADKPKKNKWITLKLAKQVLLEDDDFGNRIDDKIFLVSPDTKKLKIGNNYMVKGDIFVSHTAYHPENSILLSIDSIFPIDDNSFNKQICFNQF